MPWPLVVENASGQTVVTNAGSTGKFLAVLEDVCGILFTSNSSLQQGGDIVRVGGMTYACDRSCLRAGTSPACA